MKKAIISAIFAGLVVLIGEYIFTNSLIKLSVQIPVLLIGIVLIYRLLGK
ncbi:hypothetical protein FB379_14610 [Aeribacillus composti]|jgi:hypothetical protein|nr:hypothetical protein FB379_14610 [Aeribacillus composti]